LTQKDEPLDLDNKLFKIVKEYSPSLAGTGHNNLVSLKIPSNTV